MLGREKAGTLAARVSILRIKERCTLIYQVVIKDTKNNVNNLESSLSSFHMFVILFKIYSYSQITVHHAFYHKQNQ